MHRNICYAMYVWAAFLPPSIPLSPSLPLSLCLRLSLCVNRQTHLSQLNAVNNVAVAHTPCGPCPLYPLPFCRQSHLNQQ